MHVAPRSTRRVRLMCGAGVLAAIAVPVTAFGGFPPPTITSASPSTVSTSGGTTITGTYPYSYPPPFIPSLLIDGQPVTGWSITSSTHISLVVPAHAVGVVNIRWNQPISGFGVHADLNGARTCFVPTPETPNAPAAAAGDGQAVITVATSPGGQAPPLSPPHRVGPLAP